mmetsp:Transcript_35432/g.69778  ORF Transcript_35432/g.69778 Transcript_35432/m.69778 type:complete len:195 (+) Transcript_35432:104-688(+)
MPRILNRSPNYSHSRRCSSTRCADKLSQYSPNMPMSGSSDTYPSASSVSFLEFLHLFSTSGSNASSATPNFCKRLNTVKTAEEIAMSKSFFETNLSSTPSLASSECSSIDSFNTEPTDHKPNLPILRRSKRSNFPVECELPSNKIANFSSKEMSQTQPSSTGDEWGHFVDTCDDEESRYLCQQKGRFLVSKRII